MEKGFSKLELLISMTLMTLLGGQIMENIQTSKQKILEEGSRIAIKYEKMLEEAEEAEDIRESIIRKFILEEEFSEEEEIYLRVKKEIYENSISS